MSNGGQPPALGSPSGRFIAIEGGEGAGKSTLARALAMALAAQGGEVVATREPGGTPQGEAIRGLLLSGSAERWDPLSELLLLLAARREHMHAVIAPAVARGATVVCDRWLFSTIAYQGAGKGVDEMLIRDLQARCVGGPEPVLTLVLDLPAAEGLARARARAAASETTANADRFETLADEFHERLSACFRRLAKDAAPHAVLIDAAQPPDRVLAAALAAIATAEC